MESNKESAKILIKDLKEPYRSFYEFHGVQLIGTNFPPNAEMIMKLYDKLKNQVFDAGNHFALQENQDQETFQVTCVKDLSKQSDLFLVDHALSFRYSELRKFLEQDDQLVDRIKNMLKFWNNKKELPNQQPPVPKDARVVEHDYVDMVDPTKIPVSFNTVTLSYYANQIEDFQLVKQVIMKLPDLKCLWLNENPLKIEEPELYKIIEEEFPKIEILNSRFTANTTEWGLKYITSKSDLVQTEAVSNESVTFLDLSERNVFRIRDLEVFRKFPQLRQINLKGHQLTELEDTNKLIKILMNCKQLREIDVDNQVQDILMEIVKNQKISNVSTSLRFINGRDIEYTLPLHPNEDNIRFIMKNIWKVASSYRLANSEQLDESSVWYIQDEFGSGVQHSDKPNVVSVPFLYAPNLKLDDDAISYNILWPAQDIKTGDLIYRDYLSYLDQTKQRSSRLACWFNVPWDYFEKKYVESFTANTEKSKHATKYADQFKNDETKKLTPPPEHRPIKIITDSQLIAQNMHLKDFSFVKDLDQADLIYLERNIDEDYYQKAKGQMINQFPFESCFVMKHNLAQTVTSMFGYVSWLQRTYDLETQLSTFIGDYQNREKLNKNNIWIIQPPNMARSMDMVVTDNLEAIIRLLETGPKLAQKYIHNPVTIMKQKIDLRFIVMLRSIEPLEVFIYKVFWIRTANNDFSNDYRTREIYETHFTVMNYGRVLKQIHFDEFIKLFDEQYKAEGVNWDGMYGQIKKMVKELFIAVKNQFPQMHNERARSIYGMDVMIDRQTFNPKLLEMTFAPDCNRACKYHPTFYDDIFSSMFLNQDIPDKIDRVI